MDNGLFSAKSIQSQLLWSTFMSVLTVVCFAQEVINTNHHRLEQVADGVYFATGTGDIYTMSNALIVERDQDIVIVDSHITPAAGRALLDSIRIVSDKPVTTMINSHFHYDHSNGTPAFGEDLEIIGHQVTYDKLTGDPENEHTYQSSLRRFDSTVARLENELTNVTDSDERRQIQNQLESGQFGSRPELYALRPPDYGSWLIPCWRCSSAMAGETTVNRVIIARDEVIP